MLSSVFGGFVGAVTLPRSRRRPSCGLVVAVCYPVGLATALGIQGVEDGEAWAQVVLIVAVGVSVGSVALALRLLARRPDRTLRRGSVVWAAISVLTLPLLGLGLLGVPQTVSYRVAAQQARAGSGA